MNRIMGVLPMQGFVLVEMSDSASLLRTGEITLCRAGEGFESSQHTLAACQNSRQKLKKQTNIWRHCRFFPVLQQSLHPLIKTTSQAALMVSNVGETHRRSKAWSGPGHFCEPSSSQKSGKSSEVQSTEK